MLPFEVDVATKNPPVGAGAEIAIVATVPAEPVTVEGVRVRPVTARGPTVIVAVTVAPEVAEIVEVELVATERPVTVKVAVVAPARTVTDVGTVATLVALELRVTTVPPVGAGPPRVTVPVDVVDEAIEDGLKVRPVTTAGLTVRVAVTVTAPAFAVITADVAVPTAVVVAEKVPLVEPAATVTVPGTVVEASPDVSVTAKPPVGAAPLRVTVPVEEVPPVTAVGATATAESTAGVTVWVFVVEKPLYVAVITDVALAATPVVTMLNTVWDAPAGTVTEAGTVTTVGLLEVRVTTPPPTGATSGRMTWLPVVVVPPTVEDGLKERPILLVVT